MTETKYREGDKVRATLTGTIERRWTENDLVIRLAGGRRLPVDGDWDIQLAERGLPKVGEELQRGDADRLPELSIVVSAYGLAAQKSGAWSTAQGAEVTPRTIENWPATLLYLGSYPGSEDTDD